MDVQNDQNEWKQLSDMSVKRHVAKSRKISMDSSRCFETTSMLDDVSFVSFGGMTPQDNQQLQQHCGNWKMPQSGYT